MGLFRRRASDPANSIAEFWTWWTKTGASACAAAIADKAPERIAEEMTRRVHGLHPDLAWELAAGHVSAHKLVVTAEGNPELRPIARRWLLAAPAADETWSYDDHRGAADEPEGVALRSGAGAPEILFSDLSLSARKEGTKLDLTVHHPAFADLPQDARIQVAFLALDAALGENDTELWIGEIDTAVQAPIDGFGLLALRSLVVDLRRESLDEDGRPGWALFQGDGPDGAALAAARSPLHPLFGPMFTRHVAAHVPYTGRTDVGLPAAESLDGLRALEDDLEAELAADGLLVAHESSAGTRVFHFYVDPEGNAVDRLVAVLDAWPEGEVRVKVTDADPGWESVRHLKG
jgi:hypothetical protein